MHGGFMVTRRVSEDEAEVLVFRGSASLTRRVTMVPCRDDCSVDDRLVPFRGMGRCSATNVYDTLLMVTRRVSEDEAEVSVFRGSASLTRRVTMVPRRDDRKADGRLVPFRLKAVLRTKRIRLQESSRLATFG